MRIAQMEAAKNSMVEWLSHPQVLGKIPTKIECTGTFDLHVMRYYIFKYKRSLLGKWLLGVCGGYEGETLEHCGHVYSNMEEYHEAASVKAATEIVEQLRVYWMEQAKQEERRKESSGKFAGFVLLSEPCWDKRQLILDLKEKWDLEVAEDEDEKGNDVPLVFYIGNMTAAVSLMPAPVPDGEAEKNAENNYMWPEAVNTARAHKAHLLVAVLGKEENLLERGKLFTKIVSCCCRQKNATGVYTSGVVFEPRVYEGFADMMKEDELPVFNWIWFGLYRSEKGVCCYTYGMDIFGKDEMEVLDAKAEPSEVRDFLVSLVSYVLEYDVILRDGETIGFTADDKHTITLNEGVSLPGMTLKIGFQES